MTDDPLRAGAGEGNRDGIDAAGVAPCCHSRAARSLRVQTLLFLRASIAVVAAVTTLTAFAPPSTATAQSQTPDVRRSGFEFMSPSTQAMQRDDTANPAMLWVQDGEARWNQKAGASDKSCASCHGAAASSMRGVAARYPAFDSRLQAPLNLGQRINQCRERHQQATALAPESEALLGLEAWVARQSRGMPITPPDDARLSGSRERGLQHYRQRIGQLDLSCAQCHDSHAGGRLAGNAIPQAHPTAYPLYRLEWQALGSLQRRIRGCMSGVRAEPYAFNAQELVELELYLASRASGMLMEAPGVRP